MARFLQRLITALLLGALGLAPLVYGLTPRWAALGFQVIIVAATVLWLSVILLEREIKLVTSPVVAPVLILACYVVVRYALTDVESLARPEMLLALTGALVFLLASNHLQRREHVAWLAGLWVVVGAVVAGYGVWQVIANSPVVLATPQPAVYSGRASGTFIRPSHLAGYLSLTFYVGAAFFFFSRLGYRLKIGLAFVCVLMAVAVWLSFSVAAWVGWLAGAVVIGAQLIKRRSLRFRWLAIGSVLWLAVALGAMIAIEARNLAGNEPPRLALWKSAWAIGRDHLLIGAGPGMFRWLHPTQRGLQGIVEGVGNEFLNLFVDYGLVGVGLVGWALVAFFRRAVRIMRARAARYSVTTLSNRYAFVIGGFAAVTAAGVQAVIDLNLHAPAILLSLMALMAVVMTCGVHSTSRAQGETAGGEQFSATPVKGLMRWGLVASLGLIVLLLGSRLQQSVPAEYHLQLAQREQRRLNWPAAETHYQRAWDADPQSYHVARAGAAFYLARATWSRGRQAKLWAEAARWYERAYIRNPHDGDLLIALARILDAQGNRETAHDRYQRALQLDPHNASYHVQLGLHYQRWDDTGGAIASFRRAYELGGPDPVAELELRRLELL